MNFSEIRATIKHRDSHWQQPIILLFPGALVAQPSPYKRRRCDMSDAASSVVGGKSPAAKSTRASSFDDMDVGSAASSGSGLLRAQSEIAYAPPRLSRRVTTKSCPAICDAQRNEDGGKA